MSAAPEAIVPEGMEYFVETYSMSPGLAWGDFIFVTGMTGVDQLRRAIADPEAQIRAAFDQVAQVLAAAGIGWDHVVDMTSYHVGLRAHLSLFMAIRAEHVAEPFPAWTAIEVCGFATEGIICEIKVTARRK